MKNISLLVIFAALLLIAGCYDDVLQSDLHDNEDYLDKVIDETTNTCGNNQYPPLGDDNDWYIEWCTNTGNYSYPRHTIRLIWSKYVEGSEDQLTKRFCDNYPPSIPSEPTETDLTRNGFNLSWIFVWCDYYVVQAHTVGGGWVTLANIQNDYGEGNTSYSAPPTAGFFEFRIGTKIGSSITYSEAK